MSADQLSILAEGLFEASDDAVLDVFAGIANAAARELLSDPANKQPLADKLYSLAEARGMPELVGNDAIQERIVEAFVQVNGHAAGMPPAVQSRYGGMRFEQIGVSSGAGYYEWFVEDVIPLGEVVLIFGDSGSGKSFDSFDMAMAAARGLQWNGYNVEPGLVIYVAAEAGKGFGKRKLAYMKHHNIDDATKVPFYLFTKRPDFFSSDDDLEGILDEIGQVMRTYAEPLRAIFLDTLSALTPGMNENSSADISRFRRRIETLREAFNYRVAIIVIHHKPKGGDTPRGHGSLTNDFETTIEFETTGRDSTGRPLHKATVRKQREGKANLGWQFVLPVVVVGKNKWGRDETSCVVEALNAGMLRSGYRASGNQVLFMQSLWEALDVKGVLTPSDVKVPTSITRVVDISHVREAMKSHMVDADSDPEAAANRFRVAFKRAGDGLREAKVIGVKTPWIWPTGKPVAGLSTDIELVGNAT